MTGFDEVYKKYFNDVFRYICKLSGGNEQLAEDITSETFFKAMRTIDKFRGECDVRVWLCQIAKNSYYSYCKKNRNIRDLDEIEAEDLTAPTLEEIVIRREEAADIQRFLHDLKEPYKEVFMWRVFGELSFKQIGALYQKSENWACVTFHRAKGMIIKRMEVEKNEK